MWLIPSDNPENLHRFFMWCRDTGINSPGLVLVNKAVFAEKEKAYKEIIAPKGWNFATTEADDFVGQMLEMWGTYKNLPWVGLMGDDCIPLSIGWEKTVLGALTGWNVVCVHDDRKTGSGGIGRGSVWSGELMRAVGQLFVPGFREEEQYGIWEALVSHTGSKTYKGEVVVRRPGYEPTAFIYAAGQNSPQSWLDANGDDVVKRIEELKKEKGIIQYTLDYTGVSVMVAVPTMDGSLEYEFLGCLHETFAHFTAAGIPHEFIVEPFNADIVMARSKLFAKFMRGTCSHILMIDSDMGWEPSAVGRLFAAKKDFVAVAGPKKKIPLQCAVTPLPLDKNFGKVSFDSQTGTVEVAEVGGAFNLLTRTFGEKMIAAYPELGFMGIGGEKEHALFLPMIMEGAYKAEDYAICHRWRAIGGQVHVCPDISLKHAGRKVYEGAWSDTWPKPEAVKQAAE